MKKNNKELVNKLKENLCPSQKQLSTYIVLPSLIPEQDKRYIKTHLTSCINCQEEFNHLNDFLRTSFESEISDYIPLSLKQEHIELESVISRVDDNVLKGVSKESLERDSEEVLNQLVKNEKYEQALKLAELKYKETEDNFYLTSMFDIYQSIGSPDKAEEIRKKIVSDIFRRYNEILDEAEALYLKKEYQEAIKKGKDLIIILKKYVPGYVFLAKNYLMLNLFHLAEETGIYAYKLLPDHTVVLDLMAFIYLKLENYDKANFFLKKLIKKLPHVDRLYSDSAYCLTQQGKYRAAIININKAIKLTPESHNHYYHKANIYQLNGKISQCIKILKDYLNIHPPNSSFINFLGMIYFQEGKTDIAIKYLKESLLMDENNIWFNYNLGNCFFELNNYQQAIIYFKKALAINPNHKPTLLLIMTFPLKRPFKSIIKSSLLKLYHNIPFDAHLIVTKKLEELSNDNIEEYRDIVRHHYKYTPPDIQHLTNHIVQNQTIKNLSTRI